VLKDGCEGVKSEGPDFFRTERLRGAPKVLGEASSTSDVGVDGSPRVVAQPQVVDESLS
jgi:hypothetical protein